ncbi:MAG: glucose 1-dehydrogenase [Polyangiales bacterium]
MARAEGKVALVTGAASGIGKTCARVLANEGARVVLADRNDVDGKRAAEDLGAPHFFQLLDVTSEDAWKSAVDATVRAFGRLDILVNAAGIGVIGDVEHTSLEAWRFVQSVNVEGVFLGCKTALAVMKSGSIVNVSSVAGLIGDAEMAAYCASKGAVRLLTKSIALHCARRGDGTRCNSVHPSFIDTPMVGSMIDFARDPEKMRTILTKAAPLGRLGEPEEVAAMVLYLASDESKFVTGAEFVIDGGLTAR